MSESELVNQQPVVIPIQDGRGLEQKQNGFGVGSEGDPSYTLTATGGASVAVAFDEYNFTTSEAHQTLRAGTPQSTGVLQPVAFEPGAMSRLDGHDPAEISPTLRAQMGDNQVAVYYEEAPTPTGNLTPWPEMGQPNMVYRTDTVTRTVDNNRHNILTTIPLDLRNALRSPESEQGVGIGEVGDPSHTLTVGATHGVFAETSDEAKSVYENQRSEVREADITNALSTGGGKPGQGYPAVRVQSVVRRLTPIECERLQGFPTVENTGIIEWCSDLQKTYADAEAQNPKLPKLVLSVASEQESETATSAENISPTNSQLTDKPALVNVEVNCEGEIVEIHSQGKLMLSVNTAEKASRSAHPLLAVDFVPQLVRMVQTLGLITQGGRVASQVSEKPLTEAKSGVPFARLSGSEMTLLAKGVVSDLTTPHPPTTPTTLFPSDTSHLGQNLQTLCCSVIPAIIGFTQMPTNEATTYRLHLRVKQPWTAFRIDEKKGLVPQADTHRYKQMGNAVAVPVVEWVIAGIVEIHNRG